MSNALIAWFSHEGEAYVGGKIIALETGNTCVAAGFIRDITGAETFRIEPAEPYPYSYADTVDIARSEQKADARPRYRGGAESLAGRDVLILGYPCWCGTMPRVVMTFLEDHDLTGKTILPFCTNEGSGMGVSERDIKRLCPGAVVKPGLSIKGGRVKDSKPAIESWLRANGVI